MTFFIGMVILLHAHAMQPQPVPTAGRLVFDTIHSPALVGNLIRDPADRSVIVYLPKSYAAEPTRRYPVLYLLHGNTQHNTVWVDGTFQGLTILTAMDSLVTAGSVREMILVMPDAYNRFRGAHYVNSPVIGNWADFVTRDLVSYTDRNYRTLPVPASRGLAGFSRGGDGALRLALGFPDIYGAVYSMSGVNGYFGQNPQSKEELEREFALAQAVRRTDPTAVLTVEQLGSVGWAAAYSPNPDRAPWFVDWPFEIVNGELKGIESVLQRHRANDLEVLLASHSTNLRGLKALRIDCGTSDESMILRARLFTSDLNKLGIPHIYEEFDGDHDNRNRWRVETKLLPFFSGALAFK